ncbi:MAG: bifunctional UDP-3-O-[3-hydroxymyristoyl] N-acetylglucosamine deacetylase/3-hydroxyacyl-ACP dehydratase [Bacteroidota bacterium]|nr:bifunctional UDP-3-O-[3-hydroxymyristoyl] N-acetylglucosamine deacetylase/3-hydroxyacyl-ACP dehydratase [Bacteroidota bacterium]
MLKQKTISTNVSFKGFGLHTGKEVDLVIEPAESNYGIQFSRVDLDSHPIIPASVEYVTDTKRSTTIEKNGVKVVTVEHLLSALYALGIDNALIKINSEELPILDGSAAPYVEALKQIDFIEQSASKSYISLNKSITYKDESGAEILYVPAEEFTLSVVLDYSNKVLGTQYAELRQIDHYAEEIASCKTFVLLSELEYLAHSGLIKGGDIDNAIVIVDKKIEEEALRELAKMLGKEELKINIQGNTLNNCELKYINEPARHKLLDLIGDLALLGRPLKGHIIAKKPGHNLNTSFARILKKAMNEQEKSKPMYDLTKEPLYDINDIEKMLPHRYPFLLIDKIMEITDDGIIGVKNVTKNEPYFEGHFPGNPVMPGVLQIEAMAQTGGVFSLSKVEDPHLYSTYFMKIDNVKFKRKVIPGDTIVFDLKLISPIRRGLVHMGGKGYVNGQVCIEAEMLAQVVKDRG